MMLDSAVIDVAIGLAFIFLLVSLLVTAASEAAAGWLKWRSTHLWKGLEQLLQSPDARNQIYAHPLIKGLARVDVRAPRWGKNGQHGPSYIPSRTFALAVIDILRKPQQAATDLESRLKEAALQASQDPVAMFARLDTFLLDTATGPTPDHLKRAARELRQRLLPPFDAAVAAGLIGRVRTQLDRLSAADRAMAAGVDAWLANAGSVRSYPELRAALDRALASIPLNGANSVAEQLRGELRAALDGFEPGKPEVAVATIRKFLDDAPQRWLEEAKRSLPQTVDAMMPLLHDAAGDLERFRENLEIWFNDGMERVSGWYKRHVAVRQAAIAFFLAFALNIDALQITQTLWREPTLRQSLAASALAVGERQHLDDPSPSDPRPEPPVARQTAVLGAQTAVPDPQADAEPSKRTLTATLNVERLFSGGAARVTVTLPKAGTADTTVKATTTSDVLLLGTTASDTSRREIDFKPGTFNVAEFFVGVGTLTAERQATVDIAVTDPKDTELVGTASVTVDIAPADRFALLQKRLRGLGLPIGWECPPDGAAGAGETGVTIGGPVWCSTPTGRSGRRWTSLSWLGIDYTTGKFDWTVLGERASMFVLMLFGWSLTAAAASLGAPFWFDTLKRVASIRAGGKPPEEAAPGRQVSQPREPGQRPREADIVEALKGR